MGLGDNTGAQAFEKICLPGLVVVGFDVSETVIGGQPYVGSLRFLCGEPACSNVAPPALPPPSTLPQLAAPPPPPRPPLPANLPPSDGFVPGFLDSTWFGPAVTDSVYGGVCPCGSLLNVRWQRHGQCRAAAAAASACSAPGHLCVHAAQVQRTSAAHAERLCPPTPTPTPCSNGWRGPPLGARPMALQACRPSALCLMARR